LLEYPKGNAIFCTPWATTWAAIYFFSTLDASSPAEEDAVGLAPPYCALRYVLIAASTSGSSRLSRRYATSFVVRGASVAKPAEKSFSAADPDEALGIAA